MIKTLTQQNSNTGADETEFFIFAGRNLTPVSLTKQKGAGYQLGNLVNKKYEQIHIFFLEQKLFRPKNL